MDHLSRHLYAPVRCLLTRLHKHIQNKIDYVQSGVWLSDKRKKGDIDGRYKVKNLALLVHVHRCSISCLLLGLRCVECVLVASQT